MVKKIFTLSLLVLFSLSAFAQDRVLLHIGQNGKQEATPLKKGERAQDVIERLEAAKAVPMSPSNAAGLIDTLKYFTDDASLTTNFTFGHQDVALQYFIPAAGGAVKEFWWRNYTTVGNLHKATIRAWDVNPKVTGLSLTKAIGHYKDPGDGDGLKTPYKPTTGDQWFYKTAGAADTAKYGIDPLGTESKWLAGGLQVSMFTNVWQGIKLEDWGDSMNVELNTPFGFTLHNDTKVSDFVGASDTGMNVLSTAPANGPYHSFKFYELQRLAAGDGGWWMRIEYEWGMYVVIEYTKDRAPKVILPTYSTTLKTTARAISATVTDDNPSGGAAGIASVRLFTKKGSLATYDSTSMTGVGSTYTANAPAAAVGDTVLWYVVATDVNGNRTKSSNLSYKIFKKTQSRLMIYNNAQYSLTNAGANYFYNNTSALYDRWSGPTDGIGEVADLLALYDNVSVIDGSFPARNVFPAVQAWIKTGTALAKKNLFMSSQDYGCYIQAECADTSFAAGTFENDYLGISKLGPQDLAPTTRPFKIVPQADVVNDKIIKYNTDSSTTLWHFPTFELAFSAYPDGMTLAAGKALYKDGAGTNVVGVKNLGATFNTMFVAFDAGSLEFRSDTAKAPASDPKYMWISDMGGNTGGLSNYFFASLTSVKPVGEAVPGVFTLGQNYPNPFNPSTVIEYNVPVRSNVAISIFNILGQKVATIINDMHEAGAHRATWNGKDFSGKTAASGIYFYQMQAGSFEQVKKMMLMK